MCHQQCGGLCAHPRHAGHVIDAVATQREIVGHAFGDDAEARRDLFIAIFGRLAVVPENIFRTNQLGQVLVARDHRHGQTLCAAQGRQRADQIVGLVPLIGEFR